MNASVPHFHLTDQTLTPGRNLKIYWSSSQILSHGITQVNRSQTKHLEK